MFVEKFQSDLFYEEFLKILANNSGKMTASSLSAVFYTHSKFCLAKKGEFEAHRKLFFKRSLKKIVLIN